MRKVLSTIFLALLILIFLPSPVFADVLNPDYFTNRCDHGEIEVSCSYRSKEPFGPKTYNECAKYENNPNYRFLVGTGSSFGGSEKFCFKAVSATESINYHVKAILPLLFITLFLEIPLFLIFGFRSRRFLFVIFLANLISVPLFYLATIFLPFSGFITLIVMELIVIIFEAMFIKLVLKEVQFKKILTYSLVANTVSAILGGFLFIFLNIISGLLRGLAET